MDRYAPANEQMRTCPNCNELALPGPGREDELRQCDRCLASVRFPPLDPRVYIRPRGRGKAYPVRESQMLPHQSEPAHCGCGAEIREPAPGVWKSGGQTTARRRYCADSSNHLHPPINSAPRQP